MINVFASPTQPFYSSGPGAIEQIKNNIAKKFDETYLCFVFLC